MADVKTLLKDARKFIDEKNFKEAQECCKNILRKDKNNYFALVLLGKSLEDSDQAPLAYQKAIASKPDHPLAWQGLANYHEGKNTDADKIKLINIYKEMLNLQIEEEKLIEIITKIGQLGCSLKNGDTLNILVSYLDTNPTTNLYKVAEKHFLQLLKSDVPCVGNDISTILKLLYNSYNDDPSDSLEILFPKVIIQKSDISAAIEEIIRLKFFLSNVLIREWLCKKLCIKYVENDMSFGSFEIEQHIDNISEGIMNSKYPSLLRSMICYNKGSYLEAYTQCVPLVNYQEADPTEATFIIKCTIMLKKWSVTQKLASNFLTKAKDAEFTIQLKRFLFLSLSKQQKWKQAITTAKEIPIESLNKVELASLAESYIEAGESADCVLKHLEGTPYLKQLQALTLLKQEKYDDVVNLLQTSDDALDVFYLGKAYWHLKQHDKCLINLLKAAKLNPDHADTFLYLGHYYHYYKEDIEKAKKCYEKAHSLNSVSMCIAMCLSEVYVKLQQMKNDFELLTSLIKTKPNETWINFRLGLYYLKKREWESAILNFRNVIKSNQKDTTAFECLADAYYSRGSFTSALRAYNKVMLLDPSKAAHCLTRIGYIYSLLTQYEEAISTFKKVFEIDPYSLLALKGVGETWMRIAQKKFDANTFGTARDCAQYAVDYITKALSKHKQYFCFWKQLADYLMFITRLPDKYSYVNMTSLVKNYGDIGEPMKIEKLEIFTQAIACYSHIAKQKQQVSSYDLASAYFSFYFATKKMAHAHVSFNLTLNCIKERPAAWRNWNLLGKICMAIMKYEISQHCFIKALSVTRKWSAAKIWCNLATLYLKLKHYKLSNYCFSRGQSALPSYAQSWIGQGMIAEAICQEEAMDLFRHASRLGYHPESALGYADWVCRTLQDNKYKESSEAKYEIEGLYAIPYAIDLLEWYCTFEAANGCAYNILGVLQERFGLFHSALQSYEKAFKYAPEDKKNTILLNIGRLFVRIEKYEEAVKIYKAISEASLDSTTGLALALFKKGLYEEAYSVYDTALQWLSNENTEKADLLVAMAGIVYMFKGVDDAKTLLFHSIQISQKEPTPRSLFAICSLGIIHSDQSLSKLALSELRRYERDSAYSFDIGFLKSYLFVCEDNIEKAIKILSDCLHDHPSTALLWFCMAQYCLKIANTKAKVASCCAQKALCSAHYDEYCNAGNILASASIAEHLAGDSIKALTLAKEGLHKYPYQGEIWAALLFSLLSNNLWTEKKYWFMKAASHMRRHLNISRPLSRWVNLMEKKLNK